MAARTASIRTATIWIAAAALAFSAHAAFAQATDQKQALLERVERLEKALAEVKAELAALPAGTSAAPAPKPAAVPEKAPVPVPGPMTSAAVSAQTAAVNQSTGAGKHGFFEKKPGNDLTFYTPNGEVTAYGNLDLSFDVITKGIADLKGPDGAGPVGNMGWLPDVSTNISFVGLRGIQKVGNLPINFIYQLETGIDIANSSGIAESNSSESNVVKGGLTSRNSFLGISGTRWGAVMFGKTDAPYKQSTMRMNPFYGMVGDYQVVMGNTGGDNRVEFSTRLDHSIWFAASSYHGLRYDLLFSPGQNRSANSDNIAAGESDCTGGNIPGSGGTLPLGCNDGGFSDAVSADLTYLHNGLYLAAAYERHRKVNRSSDLTGIYAAVPAGYLDADTADEDAFKVGAQYALPSKLTVSGIYENMHRYVPAILSFQNERQRQGLWLAASQEMPNKDILSFGWARAFRAVGDPGQHNSSLTLPPFGSPGDSTGGLGVDNSVNFFSVSYTRKIARGVSSYINWAGTFNGPFAHYDLGAGGRSVTTDCHDASDATGGESSNPHCWAGGRLKGISVGLNRKF